MIQGYHQNANLTILNAKYCYPRRVEDNKYSDDFMTILYKDNNTGEKKREVIKNPTYVFYETDDDVVVDHNLFFIEKEKVNAVEVPYTDLLKKIAEDTGNLEGFYENLKSGNRYANQQLHTIPKIFNSDMQIEDHYRFRFDQEYLNEPITTLTKGYLDIETDNKGMKGDFPELGECPINAVSLINTSANRIDVFCLEDDEYEGQEEFKNGLRDGSIITELKSFIYNHMGFDKEGNSRCEKFGVDKFEYHFHFFDSLRELDMIRAIFSIIHIFKPDFMMSWNMPFDIPYIIERCVTLGADPKDILCAPDIPDEEKYCDYYIDNLNKQTPGQRGDTFDIAGYTIFLDQLVEFASRRKGQSAFDNMKLDNIGGMITGVGKLDMYKHAKNFVDFPRKAYKWFIFYNIMDTIVQHCIEYSVADIDFIFNKALINNTRYSKAHKQTIYLTNRGIKEFYNEGFIMGNNANKNNPKPPKFPGALVGDPLNNNDFSKIKLPDGSVINMCSNLVDYDFKSLYPSDMREFNIAPNTQIGKVEIPYKVHNKENPFDYARYERGGQFLEDFQCGSYLEFCSRWFHLAGYMEFLDDMKEYFNMKGSIGTMTPYTDDGKINLVHKAPDKVVIPLVKPIEMDRNIPLVTHIKHKNPTIGETIDKIKETAQMDLYDYEKIKRRKENEDEEDYGYGDID